jgi:hypothetical protein
MSGEGIFCFPLNLAASGVAGVKDGANVTIQIQFNGGDGDLFQVSSQRDLCKTDLMVSHSAQT